MPSSTSPTISANPRRVPVTRLGASGSGGHGLSLKTNMLHKGATFHSPTSPVSDIDSPFCPPQLARSQSNLDDVVDAHRRRVALTLDSIGKTLAATRISSPKKNSIDAVFLDDDSDCVPKGLLDHAIGGSSAHADQRRVLQPRTVNRRLSNHHHASDSGLGSSVASSSGKKQQQQQQTARRSAPVQAKAVTRSVAAASANAEKPAGLSARATNRIYEHTVKPLLAKPAYKAFHPILLECTTKINKRDIVCLRDLEKTILFLAPERTKVAKLYLDFCLESVRCLQTTVEYLPERDQTRPTDPPYTAGYFIDLVDQIHHYAQQLADAKANEKAGSVNMDFHRYNLRSTTITTTLLANHRDGFLPATVNPSVLTLANTDTIVSTDEIKLHGGIAVNGRPAELVRISRDGRAVSIATGLPVELEEDVKDTIRIKRSASQELEDEEEIMRSMARRKKNAPPEEYAPKMCSVPGCTKEFKRPCDLTKHEKTHSRPWKCPLESCKYHEYGWPTEKERDRHMNDKHSDNPPMYECLFKPCTYKSKRDSNRKQHMEKTHGWKYVRTKTNGSSKTAQAATPSIKDNSPRASVDASSTTLPTPQLVNLPTPQSAQSPAVATPLLDEFSAPLFGTTLANLEFPTCAPGDILATDMSLPADMNDMDFPLMDFNNDPSAYASPSTVSSLDNNSAYQDVGQDMTMFEDIYSAPMQLPTPEPIFPANYATGNKGLLDQFMAIGAPDLVASMITPDQQQQLDRLQEMYRRTQEQERQNQLASFVPHFSPLGEANTMLFTPDSMLDDEGFVDYADDASKKGTDFILYPNADIAFAAPALVPTPATAFKTDPVFDTLFEEMTPSLAAGYSQPTSQIYATTMPEWN